MRMRLETSAVTRKRLSLVEVDRFARPVGGKAAGSSRETQGYWTRPVLPRCATKDGFVLKELARPKMD